jgi:hypothetical protein
VGRKDGERIDNGAAISSGGSSTHAFFSPRLGIWFPSLLACAMTCYEATTTTHGHTTHTHTHTYYTYTYTHTLHTQTIANSDMRSLHDEQAFILFLSPAFNATGTHWYQYHQSAAESPPAPGLLYCPKNRSDRQANLLHGRLSGWLLTHYTGCDRHRVRQKRVRLSPLFERRWNGDRSCFSE